MKEDTGKKGKKRRGKYATTECWEGKEKKEKQASVT